MHMPQPDAAVIARRAEIAASCKRSCRRKRCRIAEDERRAYESDAFTAYRQSPLVVVLPSTTEEVARVLRYCHERRIKVVPRGAGTSLSGGALPLADGVLLGLGKFNRILDIDFENRCAVVQPGVTNLAISGAVRACRLLLRARSVEPDRLHHRRQRRREFGRRALPQIRRHHQQRPGRRDGDDRRDGGAPGRQASRCRGLRSSRHHRRVRGIAGRRHRGDGAASCASPRRRAPCSSGFPTSESAGICVAAIIGAGIIPGGMEMMDRPAIHAAEDFVHAGYPLDVEALLIVELDGPLGRGRSPDRPRRARSRAPCGAVSCRASESEEERLRFWAGRKAAFPAVGRISPDYYCVDGTIPRRCLAEVLTRMTRARRAIRSARRQRVPCRRRQSPSAHPL